MSNIHRDMDAKHNFAEQRHMTKTQSCIALLGGGGQARSAPLALLQSKLPLLTEILRIPSHTAYLVRFLGWAGSDPSCFLVPNSGILLMLWTARVKQKCMNQYFNVGRKGKMHPNARTRILLCKQAAVVLDPLF